MEVYGIELCVLDFEGVGIDEIKELIERNKYISPTVVSIKKAHIEEWDDDLPINNSDTFVEEYHRMFKVPSKQDLTNILVLLGEALNTDSDSAIGLVIEACDKLRTFW